MPADPRPDLYGAGTTREDGTPEFLALPGLCLPTWLQPPDADCGTCYAPAPIGDGHCDPFDDHDPRVDPHVCWGQTTADGVHYVLEWRESGPDEDKEQMHDAHEQHEDMPWPEVRGPADHTDCPTCGTDRTDGGA